MNSLGRTALIPVALLLVLFLMAKGCSGHGYDVSGTYEAPIGGYRVEVSSKQHEATSEVDDLDLLRINVATISSTAGGRPVIKLEFLEFGRVRGSINAAATVLEWSDKERKNTLQKLLVQAGYVNPPDRELQEMAQAIEGIVHGPAGIIGNEDQAKAIKVVKVVSK